MKKRRDLTTKLKNSLEDLNQARKNWEDIEKETDEKRPFQSPKDRFNQEAPDLFKKLKDKLEDFS